MALFTLYRGQTYTAEVDFIDSNGQPVVPKINSSAVYTVFDQASNVILSGSATQDQINTEKWFSQITIPDSALVSEGAEKYYIIWDLIASDNSNHTSREYFIVTDGEPQYAQSTDITTMEGSIVEDRLILNSDLEYFIMEIRDLNDEILYTSNSVDNPVPAENRFGLKTYVHNAGIVSSLRSDNNFGLAPYYVFWYYKLPGVSVQLETHALYVLSTRMLHFINVLSHDLDKAKNLDIDETLRFDSAEYAHFILEGLNSLNMAGTTLTGWTISTVPKSLYSLLTLSAKIHALRAWSLAEGLRAFDFSGQSTQLTIDRTQYIENLLGKLESEFEQRSTQAKTLFIKSRSPGVLNISVGPHTNYPTTQGTLMPYMSRVRFSTNF